MVNILSILNVKRPDLMTLNHQEQMSVKFQLRYTHFCWRKCTLNDICKIVILFRPQCVNTLRPRQNVQHFTGDIFKCIFFNENTSISIIISLKFAPRGPFNNIPALVQIMAWCGPGDKPLSEPMMIILLTHICITRPQWVNTLGPTEATWCWRSWSTLVQVIAWCMMTPSHYLNQY